MMTGRFFQIGQQIYGRNIHLGISVSTQADLDAGIDDLVACPASVRWLSLEPLLESIRIRDMRGWQGAIDWVVVGGESGPGARPMNPDWVRRIRDECVEAGVPFFIKQMGGHPDKRAKLEDIPDDLRIREFPVAEGDKVKG